MTHKLVIAEKPSVAQTIAAVIGATNRCSGYMEGNGYIVSWCVGHLVSLSDASEYDEKYRSWTLKDLPILPSPWKYSVNERTKQQFEVLRRLMERKDVEALVCATDAGREGELIFRLTYMLAGCRKPCYRLWISSMEDAAIREGFAQLKPGSDYDRLYAAALCRAKADWLVGINASRFFSLQYDRKLSVGRVVSPTLALLVQREAQISAFVPTAFYVVHLDCGFPLASDRFTDRAEASSVAASCKGAAARIVSVKQKEKAEKPPALYDLTTLQREANRLLGYTAQQTLDYAQNLYEKKLLTYPRTDSRYLTDDMLDKVPAFVRTASAICQADCPGQINAAQICNSKKVSDHYALIPTAKAGSADLSALPVGERELLKLTALALLRAVGDPCRYVQTEVSAECAGHSFSAKGKTVLDIGWRAYGAESDEKKETSLPELKEGQTCTVRDTAVKDGKTTPPKHFTEDTLLSAMENCVDPAGDQPLDAERKGLGTPATRAGIIEKLVSGGFVQRRKVKKVTNLIPTAEGAALITVLPEALQSPLLTAEWEQRLKQIELGDLEPDAFLADITEMLRDIFLTYQPVPGSAALFGSKYAEIGKCPRCGAAVRDYPKGFNCENRACGFALWKDNAFFRAKKKTLTKQIAESLLKTGSAQLKGCYSERTGKTYDAIVALDYTTGKNVNYKLSFENNHRSGRKEN